MGAIDKKEGKLHLLQAPKKVKGDSPKKNGKSSFLPQIGLMDRPTGNDNRIHRSLEGVPISG